MPGPDDYTPEKDAHWEPTEREAGILAQVDRACAALAHARYMARGWVCGPCFRELQA